MSERTLSDADLEALRETLECHSCRFTDDQVGSLQGLAGNIALGNKIAARFIISGIVITTIGGVGGAVVFAIKKFIIDVVTAGNGGG